VKFVSIAQMKLSQVQPLPPQQTQQVQQPQQGLAEALDPRTKTIFNNALSSSGLNKQKTWSFLDNLFTELGDIPIAKVANVLKLIVEEETKQDTSQQTQQNQQNQQNPPVQNPPVQDAQGPNNISPAQQQIQQVQQGK